MKTRLPKTWLAAILSTLIVCGTSVRAAGTTIDTNTESSTNFTLSNGDSFTVTNGATYDMSTAATLEIENGDITVTEGSTFLGGNNNFWFYDGTVNVEDSSKMEVCTYDAGSQNYRVLLGLGSSSTITVKSGASFTSSASQFVSNFYNGSTVTISVDGEGSKFIQTAKTQKALSYPIGSSGTWVYQDGQSGKFLEYNRGAGWYDADSTGGGSSGTISDTITYLCDTGTDKAGKKYGASNNCSVNISATNGGAATFDSVITYVGSVLDKDANCDNKSATFNVDEKSSISFKRLEVYADTEVTNNGTFSATEVTVHDAATLTFHVSSADVAAMKAEKLLVKEGAELGFAQTNEEFARIALFGTDTAPLSDTVAATLDADLILEKGAILTLNGGALDLNGNNLTIEDGAIINAYGMDDANADGKYTLFTNFSASEQEYTVKLNGIDTIITYDSVSGTIYSSSIPEPTTTTLSLLALAGLAMRRRRK